MPTIADHCKRVEFANTLRGIAAISVLVSHYFGKFWLARNTVAFFINAPELPITTHATPAYLMWLHKIPIFDWGAYGVALFFIISGFVIPFSLQKGNKLEFCIGRIFRIMPVYFIGFSVTLLALFLSTAYFNVPWPYTEKELLIHYIPGLRDILWSRNIDAIIWTLEIEIKFYVVCALMINNFRLYSKRVFFIPAFLFIFACYCIHNLSSWETMQISTWKLAMTYIMASQYIIFMFIGVIFHYLFCQKIALNKGYLGVASFFFLFCLDWWVGPYSASFYLVWSYGFALLTFMFAYSCPHTFKANRVFNFFADISYPLYVIHGLAGYVVLRILLDKGCKAWLALIVVCSGAMFLSWVIHKYVEYPTTVFGKKLGAALTRWMLPTSTLHKFNRLLMRPNCKGNIA